MIMKAFAAGAFVIAATSHSFAQSGVATLTVPTKGAVYCIDPDDIIKMAAGQKANGTCGVIPGGSKIAAVGVQTTNGITGGYGIVDGINNGKAVAFVFSQEDANQAAPEKKAPFEARTFKRVSPADVEATPDKWKNRDIEFQNVNVYWVSDDDVRFVTSANVTVFASDVQGENVAFYRDNCETAKEAFSSKCRVTIRFSYAWHGEDNPSSRSTRTVLKTTDIQIQRRGPRR